MRRPFRSARLAAHTRPATSDEAARYAAEYDIDLDRYDIHVDRYPVDPDDPVVWFFDRKVTRHA